MFDGIFLKKNRSANRKEKLEKASIMIPSLKLKVHYDNTV